MLVKDIKIYKIFTSTGNETVEAVINSTYRASSAAGTSESSFAAKSVPVDSSIKNFSRIKKQFTGSFTQKSFDAELKKHFVELGSIMTTALSLAFFLSSVPKTTFPNNLGKVIGGGAHAKSRTTFQEFLVTPKAKTMEDVVKNSFAVWKAVGSALREKGHTGLDYECGWTADINDEKALELISKIRESHDFRLGMDAAASNFYKNGVYAYPDNELDRDEQIDFIVDLAERYDIYYIEDPLDEKDYEGFSILRQRLPKVLITGDDIIASNPERLKKAIGMNAMNGVIVKPNQIGNVSDCLELIDMAKKNNIVPVVSHRSSETCSGAVARLALYGKLTKFGIAGIRTAKLNELLRLWHDCKKPRLVRI